MDTETVEKHGHGKFNWGLAFDARGVLVDPLGRGRSGRDDRLATEYKPAPKKWMAGLSGFADFQSIIRHVEYKPGWGFRMDYRTDYPSPMWTLTMWHSPPDSTTDEQKPIQIMASVAVPMQLLEYRDTKMFLSWLREEIGKVEMHERDEWLKVHGELIWNPHQVRHTF
jgi:hypothetical protein